MQSSCFHDLGTGDASRLHVPTGGLNAAIPEPEGKGLFFFGIPSLRPHGPALPSEHGVHLSHTSSARYRILRAANGTPIGVEPAAALNQVPPSAGPPERVFELEQQLAECHKRIAAQARTIEKLRQEKPDRMAALERSRSEAFAEIGRLRGDLANANEQLRILRDQREALVARLCGVERALYEKQGDLWARGDNPS